MPYFLMVLLSIPLNKLPLSDGTVTRTVCFNGYDPQDPCFENTEIQVRNCGTYFLYYLPDTPLCMARYCSE